MPARGRPKGKQLCECKKPHFAKGLCRVCYDAARRTERAETYRARRARDPEFRDAERRRVREAMRRSRSARPG
jgi:hypothetical protein